MRNPIRRKQNWYVVQVTTGREDAMCATIERACREHDGAAEPGGRIGLRECFSPKFQRRRKWKGEWQDVERAFLPGYVIAVTDNPAALAQALRGVREFCRVLAVEETYIPLAERERALLETHTGQPDRVIPLSFGYKAGDRLTVTEGPLAGNEVMITKLDRQNCLAHIEFRVGPITFKATVGLVVMPSGKVRQVER